MTTKSEIGAVQSELASWLYSQPQHVRDDWSHALGLLGSAQIGAKPSPAIVGSLAAEVARIEAARANITLAHQG